MNACALLYIQLFAWTLPHQHILVHPYLPLLLKAQPGNRQLDLLARPARIEASLACYLKEYMRMLHRKAQEAVP